MPQQPSRAIVHLILACPLGILLAGPADFPTDGLILHLDASRGIERKADSTAISRWTDLSPRGQALALVEKGRLSLTTEPPAMVRFSGNSGLTGGPLRDQLGGYHVFLVARREAAQGSKISWQRLVSFWNGVEGDNKAPNFCITGDASGSGAPFETCLIEKSGRAVLGRFGIGVNADGAKQFYQGDLAEILIYDRAIDDLDVLLKIRATLKAKWGAKSLGLDPGWTRTGTNGAVFPKRVTERWPLSDQENRGLWKVHEPWSDEFNGEHLDATKWHPNNPGKWIGREPVMFHPKNVAVEDGELRIRGSAKETEALPAGFTHTSGFVRSTTLLKYGYIEMRARLMPGSMNSCFWLHDGPPEHWTEIDIVENPAGVHPNRLNMNVHIFRTSALPDLPAYSGTAENHLTSPATWDGPFSLCDDFHVFGCEWDPGFIAWYVDGLKVRQVSNVYNHWPLGLDLNLEANSEFKKDPMETRLPGVYRIDYVRTWVRAERAK